MKFLGNKYVYIFINAIFIITLFFSIYNKIYFLKFYKFSYFDYLIFVLNSFELLFYMLSIIYFFLKNNKFLLFFILAISLSSLYIILNFLFKLFVKKYFINNDLPFILGYFSAGLLIIILLFYLSKLFSFSLKFQNEKK